MRRSILAAAVAALVLVTPATAQAIVYGEPDNGEHPNVGSFVAELDLGDGETILVQLCTGTLVATDVVLSAAHCFSGVPSVFGPPSFTLDEVIDADQDGVVDADVALLEGAAVPHPEFVPGHADNDVAVFLLQDAVTGVDPASIAEIGVMSDRSRRLDTFTAVGYGVVRETNRKSSQSFMVGWRREKADQTLLSVTKQWATFSMNLATGNGGTCYGDSGGPHFLGDVVVSVTVTGDVPCKATDKTYRVDTSAVHAFVGQYVSLD
jgi:secreted trypsin-like serine protease